MKLNFHSENPKLHSKYKICKKATLEQSQDKENWSKRQTRKFELNKEKTAWSGV